MDGWMDQWAGQYLEIHLHFIGDEGGNDLEGRSGGRREGIGGDSRLERRQKVPWSGKRCQ